ncbi:major facilitator superfamily domain-containing protein 6-like [Ptychodera flava]|uniref:major facilitator superfamily domain-containing protein 6-like n=1 Tax=Ptychodera flava TaxID=63121 RepID=UPI003969BD1A
MKCEVNKVFLPVKAVYFFYLSAKAVLIPYLPVYFKQLGISSVHIGIIFGLEPFIGFIFKPLWGMLADKFSKQRLILVCGLITSMILTMSCRFVPGYYQHSVTISQFDNQSLCNKSVMEPIGEENSVEIVVNESHSERDISWMAVKILCYSCCSTKSVSPLPDGYAYNYETILHECIDLSSYWDCDTCNETFTFTCNRTNSTSNNSTEANGNCTNSTKDDALVRFVIAPYSSVPKNVTHAMQARSLCPDKCTLRVNDDSPVCDCPREPEIETPSSSYPEKKVPIIYNIVTEATTKSANIPNDSSMCNMTATHDIISGDVSLTFWLCLLLVQLSAVFSCLVHPLVDMTVYELLGENRGDYGKQRLWGAVGWGSFAVVSGLMMDAFSKDFTAADKNYDSSFAMFIILMIITAVVASQLHIPTQTPTQSMFSSLGVLLRQADIIAFLMLITVMGMCFGTIMTFLFVYLQEMGAPQVLMGLSLTVACISETPFLFFSGHIIKYIGNKGVFYLVLLSYIIRFLGYSFITNPWFVLPLELLHGITFGAMYAAVTNYGSIIAPPGMAATVQSLVAACNMGVGKGLGGLLGGIVYKAYGGKVLFCSFAVLCFLTGLLYWIVQFCIVRTTPFYSKFRTRNESVSLQEPGDDPTADRDILELLEDDDIMMPHHKMSSRVMKLNLRSIHRPQQIAKYDQDSEAARGLILDLSPVVSDISPPRGATELSPSVTSVSSRVPMLETETTRQPAVGEDSDSEPPIRLPALGMETFYIDDQIEDIAMEYDMGNGMGASTGDGDDL